MIAMSRILLLMFVIHLISCGNKAPLVLPDNSMEQVYINESY